MANSLLHVQYLMVDVHNEVLYKHNLMTAWNMQNLPRNALGGIACRGSTNRIKNVQKMA